MSCPSPLSISLFGDLTVLKRLRIAASMYSDFRKLKDESGLVSGIDEAKFDQIISCLCVDWANEPGLKIEYERCAAAGHHYPGVIDYVNALPNGVISHDPNYPDLVQTSNSLGVVLQEDNTIQVLAHGRSSSADELDELVDQCAAAAAAHNAVFQSSERYPGWQPNADSKLLKHAVSVYESLFGESPRIESIHAGLETGIIGDKIGSNELLSYGPTIINAHSPEESLSIPSLHSVYRFLKAYVTSES